MQEIKNKIGRFILVVVVKLFKLDSHDLYVSFQNEIKSKAKILYELEKKEAIDNFRGFRKMPGYYSNSSISEHIKEIDPKCITFNKNNLVN